MREECDAAIAAAVRAKGRGARPAEGHLPFTATEHMLEAAKQGAQRRARPSSVGTTEKPKKGGQTRRQGQTDRACCRITTAGMLGREGCRRCLVNPPMVLQCPLGRSQSYQRYTPNESLRKKREKSSH